VNELEHQKIKLIAQLDSQQRLLQHVLQVYETERQQWVQLLHDDFGQSLAAIKSFAVGIKNENSNNRETYDLADIIQSTANEMYIRSYDLMRSLRSGFSDDGSLLNGIQVCLDNSRLNQKGIRVQVHSQGEVDNFSQFLNVMLLRIIQDSINGIVRSSKPTEIEISLQIEFSQLQQKILILQICSNVLNKDEFDNANDTFLRCEELVKAIGGEYSLSVKASDTIDIRVKIDITDFIEETREKEIDSD